jgi:putative endonuclease
MLWAGFAYILANKNNTTLYTGAAGDLYSRLYEHRTKMNKGFSSRYNTNKLVYYECFNKIELAFDREAEITSWSRQRKVNLIESINPDWADLTSEIHADRIERYPSTSPR